MEHSDPHPVPEDQVQGFLFGEMMNRFSNKQSPKTQTLLFSAQIYSKILQKTNEKTMVQKLYGRARQGIIGSKTPSESLQAIAKKTQSHIKNRFKADLYPGSGSVRTKIENLAIIRSERTGCQEGRLENQKKVFWTQIHAGIKENKGFQAVSASSGTILQMFKMLFQKITGNMYVQLTKKEDISRKLAETDTNKENSKFRALFGRKQTLVWE